jgi:hypothetical protein
MADTPEKPRRRTEDVTASKSMWRIHVPTWFGHVRAAEVKERRERDDIADQRVDKWAERALTVAETNLARAERMVRYQWLVIAVLIAGYLVLAGHRVVVAVTADGGVDIEAGS